MTARYLHGLAALLLALTAPAAALELVSASPTGRVGTEASNYPSISADGRWVVFQSRATNLFSDVGACGVQIQPHAIYLRDTLTGAIQQLGPGQQPTAISATGRHAAYLCGAAWPSATDVCVYDRVASTTAQLSLNANWTDNLRISADGRFVAYVTSQVYVYDRCVSDGTPVPSCTAGAQIASVNGSGVPANASSGRHDMSSDGQYVVFSSGGSNMPGGPGVFVRDRVALTTERVVDIGNFPSISEDGRYVSGSSTGHVYVRDRTAGTTELISQSTAGDPGNSSSSYSAISADGRYVAFESAATNLVGTSDDNDSDDDVFLRDRDADTTVRISQNAAGVPSDSSGHYPYLDPQWIDISGDGHRVLFATVARNLAVGDQNGRVDVFTGTDCAAAAPTCGDSSVYAGCETCDDGNTTDADGCDSTCKLTGCGSGVVTGSETCDDGNAVNGDGCDTNCTPSGCGNGIRAGAEACDDGNTTANDACSPTCELELAYYVPGGAKKNTDCWHEFRTDPAPLPDPRGLPKRELKCTDDDPSCDFGGTAGDHACTFHVRMCFNVIDSRLADDTGPLCAPDEIETIRLTKPKQSAPRDAAEVAIRDAFEAVFLGYGACVGGSCTKPSSMINVLCETNADCDDEVAGQGVCTGRFAALLDVIEATNECGPTMDIVVPLKFRNGVYAKAKRSLALTAEPTPDPVTFRLRKGDADKLSLTCLPPP